MKPIDPTDNTSKRYLTRKEAAEFMRLSRTTFRKIVIECQIPEARLSRRPLYDERDLIKVLESRKVTATKSAS